MQERCVCTVYYASISVVKATGLHTINLEQAVCMSLSTMESELFMYAGGS